MPEDSPAERVGRMNDFPERHVRRLAARSVGGCIQGREISDFEAIDRPRIPAPCNAVNDSTKPYGGDSREIIDDRAEKPATVIAAQLPVEHRRA